jgi:hypothetical protein
MTSPVATDA